MTAESLPFERAFRQWIDEHGMGWQRRTLDGIQTPTHVFHLTPAGPPARRVIALHGAGNDALFGWVGLFKKLLLANAEILTIDLPGHGRRNRTEFSPSAAVETIARVFEEPRRSARQIPVHAVGISLGGALLLAALPKVQRWLESVALVVAPLRIRFTLQSILPELRPHNFGILIREREHYGLTGLIPSFGPFRRDVYPLRLAGEVPRGSFGYIDVLNDALDELALQTAAREVHIPSLLIYGEHDRIVPIEQGEQLAGLIPHSILHPVASGTHLSTPIEPATIDRIVRWFSSGQ